MKIILLAGHLFFALTCAAFINHPSALVVAKEHNMAPEQVHCDAGEIERQSINYENMLEFSAAMSAAFKNLLTDYRHPESLLAQLMAEGYEDAHKQLHALLSHPATFFALVSQNPLAPIFPAEHGENLEDNWIFFFKAPRFSDHLYWIIVNRQGKKESYNYGFN